jgi:hypothetical protein
MKSTLGWMGGMMVAAVVLAAPALWAEEAAAPLNPQVAAKAAERAIENNDPDAVDPNSIKGDAWTLDFQYEAPVAIVVKTADGTKQVFWYVVYTVTNSSKEEHNFVPAFTLMSDTGVVRKAGVYPAAYEAIKMNRKIPFLENAAKMIGPIHPGVDNARTGVAIFAPLDVRSDIMSIFVGGLSGQYIERPKVQAPGAGKAAPAKPAAAEETPKAGKKGDEAPAAPVAGKPTAQEIAAHEAANMRFRKTLELQFRIPSGELWINLDRSVFLSKRWTWR